MSTGPGSEHEVIMSVITGVWELPPRRAGGAGPLMFYQNVGVFLPINPPGATDVRWFSVSPARMLSHTREKAFFSRKHVELNRHKMFH